MPNRYQHVDALKLRCPEVDETVLRDFVLRMDKDYFQRFTPDQMATHLRLVARLDLDHPCQASISEATEGQFDIAIVAYDYFSEFAAICGLLAGYGLDIREGTIYTFEEAAPLAASSGASLGAGTAIRPRRRPSGPAGLSRKKIVDIFRVRPLPGETFHPSQQDALIAELGRIVKLLDQNQIQDVRRRVNRRLAEALGHARGRTPGLLYPVQITFDNDSSPRETVMEIRSVDTPAFLYAFANALAMRGIYIRQARFENVDGELRDRFHVRGRHGGKIEDQAEQQELRFTAALLKQFTQFLTQAPDPAKAIEYFDRFLDRMLEEGSGGKALAFLKDRKTLDLLARLLGTSDFLWEDFLRRQHVNLLPMLGEYQRLPLIRPRTDLAGKLRGHLAKARSDEQRRKALNQFKDEELFRIDMKHLLDTATALPEFSKALTELAEVILDEATRLNLGQLARKHGHPKLADGSPCPFAVFGAGKFGGRELGYASDIEVLFVYGGSGRTAGRRPLDNSEYFERAAQGILQSIEAKQEGIFHLDVRLRPHGGKGLLAAELGEMRSYYSPEGLSAPFERQALIKLRFVAGDAKLGREVEAHRDRYVYSNRPWDLPTALDLRRRQIAELVEPGRTNVKYSAGGLIDIEYAVQYLQIMHGGRLPQLRSPNTLEALAALEAAAILSAREAAALRDAYLFLRYLIDALRIVRGHAKDLVLPPPDSDAFVFLARRLGYTSERWQEGAARLAADINRHMAQARKLFSDKFGPLGAPRQP